VSSVPAINAILELIERLRVAVRDFTAREEQLEREFRAEHARIEREYAEALQALEARTQVQSSEAESARQTSARTLTTLHERRAARIHRTHDTLKRRHLQEIDDGEARRKFEVQRDTLRTTRQREADLKANDAHFTAFTAELAGTDGVRAEVEDQARGTLGGFRAFHRLLENPPEASAPAPGTDHLRLHEELQALLARTSADISRLGKSPLVLLFRFIPVWLWVILVAATIPTLAYFKIIPLSLRDAGIAAGGGAALFVLLYWLGQKQTTAGLKKIVGALARAGRLHQAAGEASVAHRQSEITRINTEADATLESLEQQWSDALAEAMTLRDGWTKRLDVQAGRAATTNEQMRSSRMEVLEQTSTQRTTALRESAQSERAALEADRAKNVADLESRQRARWEPVQQEWQAVTTPIYAAFAEARAQADAVFPPWSPATAESWQPPSQFCHAARFARLDVDVEKLAGRLPHSERLALPGEARFSVPLLLTFPAQGSVLFETKDSGNAHIAGTLNNVILRLLSVAPPGRLSFTILDPVELGQNFAGLMHLADFEERLINSRIWTQADQIEQRLADLNEHIEKVTQMYLRNEYETITQYNEQAGRIAEKYHFLVVADFPSNFSELAVKRLMSIAASGARCGVYTFIHWDQRRPVPPEFVADEVRKHSLSLRSRPGGFALAHGTGEGVTLVLDPPPDPATATEFLQKVGKASIDSNRVEMPFSEIAPDEAEIWSNDATSELRVAIGRTGATKQQYMALGKGTRQHVLVAGKTGSGKSTLFHVLITNCALWCSPEQVEFYLVDFKKGVEFKCYAASRLPHARVVAIESDREFSLSVLQRLDEELRRRGDLFRQLGVQDLPGYRKAASTDPLPRTLLLIDEFQEFFVDDDQIAQNAALLLDRIVRQGRAFGIHVVLGSQTLGGAYTLARTTLGQMVIRIALQCNEADSYLIMDENNAAPRLLSRPGEAIYNDAAGAMEGNSPFQIVWLPDEVRETYLNTVRARADAAPRPFGGPIVFEGNAPADVTENDVLREWFRRESIPAPPPGARAFLGAPNSIKGPTEAVFQRQSGNHLLLVGQREEAILALMGVSVLSLAAQYPRGTARFLFIDTTPAGTQHRDFIEHLARVVPHDLTLVSHAGVPETMRELTAELDRRTDPELAAHAPPVFVFIRDLQRFKALRHEEDFGFSTDDSQGPKPGPQFEKVVSEGASVGLHLIVSCDTLNNVNRFLSRKALTEFEMRVLFQMSANDSASLIDSSKAGNLGLHRALFHNAQQGYLETFRPYGLPSSFWLDEAARELTRLRG
jgi:hypothetical protein